MNSFTWKSFKNQLLANEHLLLQFRYAAKRLVNPSYHITEIKQATVTSVDCGGVMNAWTEVIMQLWEPTDEPSTEAMKVSKAMSIINLVESKLPLNPNGIVKIEFGNAGFDTRQMVPATVAADGDNLIVDLHADTVQCKAIERGGSCGTDANGDECCTPEAKPKLPLINLARNSSACTPGSGCC